MRTEEEKAKRKEAHRASMVASGGLFVTMALLAALVLAYRGATPGFLFGRRAPEGAPRLQPDPAAKPLVRWLEWGPEAVARAKAEDKPILLSVHARWSRPCLLMDSRAYADQALAELVAARFVAARADADARPDAVRRYLSHGWPTTAVLLPNGQILDSATYMEADVMRRWLEALASGWERGRARARDSAAKALEERAKAEPPKAAAPEAIAARARRELLEAHHGPRFARWRRIALLRKHDPESARRLAREALALQDPDRGGFRRYAHGPGWQDPEDEYALEDQADAVRALAPLEPEAAARAAAFVEKLWADPKGGWRASDGDPRVFTGPSARFAAALLESGRSKARALRALDRAWSRARRGDVFARELGGEGGVSGLLEDSLAMIDAELAAGRLEKAAQAALGAERAFLDEASGALYDRVAPGELPPELDRVLDPALNFEARRLFAALGERLAPGDPRRERFRARAAALAPWLLARAPWLDPAERISVASP